MTILISARAALAVFGLLFGMSVFGATMTSAQDGRMSLAETSQGHKLKVINKCKKPIWIQQQNITGAPEIVKLTKKGKHKSHTYRIASGGDASTRIWAKGGCNKKGQNCKVGQTIAPCPAGGCQPAIDSLLEATFGCSGRGCNIKTTYANYDFSQVDGYTFPFVLSAKGTVDNPACLNVNCAKLTTAACPRHEDISSNGKYPAYKDVDLRFYAPGSKKNVVGCFSPCEKLTAAKSLGGYGLDPSDDEAVLYCCPTAADREECLKGPVVKTDYVKTVHKSCASRAYAWAYDDIKGDHTCSGIATLTMKMCAGNK